MRIAECGIKGWQPTLGDGESPIRNPRSAIDRGRALPPALPKTGPRVAGEVTRAARGDQPGACLACARTQRRCAPPPPPGSQAAPWCSPGNGSFRAEGCEVRSRGLLHSTRSEYTDHRLDQRCTRMECADALGLQSAAGRVLSSFRAPPQGAFSEDLGTGADRQGPAAHGFLSAACTMQSPMALCWHGGSDHHPRRSRSRS
jgi:hypothetical protein